MPAKAPVPVEEVPRVDRCLGGMVACRAGGRAATTRRAWPAPTEFVTLGDVRGRVAAPVGADQARLSGLTARGGLAAWSYQQGEGPLYIPR